MLKTFKHPPRLVLKSLFYTLAWRRRSTTLVFSKADEYRVWSVCGNFDFSWVLENARDSWEDSLSRLISLVSREIPPENFLCNHHFTLQQYLHTSHLLSWILMFVEQLRSSYHFCWISLTAFDDLALTSFSRSDICVSNDGTHGSSSFN